MQIHECTCLTSIVIPDNVGTIGEYAFAYCENLSSVIIGKGVSYIGESAFYKCKNLITLNIPSSVKNIGYYAFYGCSLETINSEVEIPPTIKSNTFSDYNAVLYVPRNSIELYRERQYWREFSQITTAYNITITNNKISVKVVGGELQIEGVTDGVWMNVYSENGTLQCSCFIEDKYSVSLPRGVYVVQIGNIVKKVKMW